MSPLEQIDVIIPTLNAATSLAATLAALPPGVAVIVSDGGSTDHTTAIAHAAGARVVTGPRGRGCQLAAGAREATRPWWLFLHADTTVSPEGWAAISRHIERPDARNLAASLRLEIDDPAWQARVIEKAVAWRVRHMGLPYGDQGLLIHRDLYGAVGGYPDLPLMEDVEMIRRLGKGRHVGLSGAARTSAARWRRRGWIRQTALNLTCISLYRLGVSAGRIAKLYGR